MNNNVIMVDDEIEMIRAFQSSIAWEEYGCNLVGIFNNADTAIECMAANRINIVFIDINMPRKDGYAFLKEARVINPEVIAIFLTCHDSFQYAKQAIDLRVNEYVVKQTVTEKDIIKLLCKYSSMNIHELEDTSYEINGYFESVITNKLELEDISRLDLKLMRTQDFNGGRTLTCFYKTDTIIQKKDDLLETCRKKLCLAMPNKDKFYTFLYRKRIYLYIEYNNGGVGTKEKLDEIFDVIAPVIENNDLFGISIEMHLNEALFTEYVQKLNDEKQLFYTGEQRNHYYEGTNHHPLTTDTFTLWMDAYKKKWNAREYQQLREYLKKLSEIISTEMPSKKDVVKLYRMFLFIIQSSYYYYDMHNDFYLSQSMTLRYAFLHELLVHEIDMFEERLDNKGVGEIPKDIKLAMEYITEHYLEDITRDDVAKAVYMNPSYLSRIFKKYVGENFSVYILKLRLEKSMEMIVNTNLSMDEIATELGFKDSSYFYKVFKKYYGTSPGSYKSVH